METAQPVHDDLQPAADQAAAPLLPTTEVAVPEAAEVPEVPEDAASASDDQAATSAVADAPEGGAAEPIAQAAASAEPADALPPAAPSAPEVAEVPAMAAAAAPEVAEVAAPEVAEALAEADLSVNEAPTLTLPALDAPRTAAPAPPPRVPAAASQPAPAPAVLQPAAPQPPAFSASLPQPALAAEPALSPAEELAAFQRRRMWGGLILVALLIATGLMAFQLFGSDAAPPPAATLPPVQAGAPAAVPPAQVGAPAGDAAAVGECSPIAGLPVFAGASCIEQERDEDDGQVKLENRYAAPATPDTVRQFYESAFTQGGWAIDDTEHDADDQQWQYTVEQGDRKLKVSIEPHDDTPGTTDLRIAEK